MLEGTAAARFAAFAVVCATLTACQAAPAPTAAAPVPVDTAAIATAIKAQETSWNAEWAARDSAKVTANYAADAVLMVPGVPVTHGSEAIGKLVQAVLTDPAFTITFAADKVDVAASGDLAVTTGSYKQSATNPATKKVDHEAGGYVTVYKKQADGAWKAVSDINAPAAAPAKPG